MSVTGVMLAGAVSVLFVKTLNIPLGQALGLFAGSGTSTPTLLAAIAALGNDDAAVGYSVSYPFGVAGPILFWAGSGHFLTDAVPGFRTRSK